MATTLKIGVWGTEDRFRRMLALFLSRKAGDAFTVSDLADADIAVVDLDGFNAERQWQAFRAQYGSLPTLVMSVEERDLPDASCVLKPIHGDELLKALRRLERSALKRRRAEVGNEVRPLALKAAPVGTALHAARLLGAPEIARLPTSAVSADAVDPGLAREPSRHYDPGEYLQGIVERALAKARETSGPVAIRGLGQDIEILAQGAGVRTVLNDAQVCALCHVRFDVNFTPYLIVVGVTAGPHTASVKAQDVDAFRWKVALWSSRGRLLKGVDPNQAVRLRRWPNLTRWTRLKFDMQLAALWFQFGFSPRGIGERFGIPQRYINSFHSAGSALDLFEPNADSHDRKPLTSVAPSAEKRGFLARLLGFLGGRRHGHG
ncbi:MAG: hypothetical protein ACFCUG_10535 [Thiotrichales bacterium]